MFVHAYKETRGPYWVAAFDMLPVADRRAVFDFCYQNFGPGLGDMRVAEPCDSPFVHRWVNDIHWGEVRFSNEADLTAFLLRWQS